MVKRTMLHNKGFTIVELLIATAVFGVVLLLATMGMLQVGRTYYKGLSSTQTQGAARAIIDDVAQAIQFTGGTINLPADATPGWTVGGRQVRFFCTQEKRYIFVPGVQLLDSGNNHVFMSDNQGLANGCIRPSAWPNGATDNHQELFQQRMRLASFDISNVNTGGPNLYKISIRVVYGDDDLLCSPKHSGDCSLSSDTTYLYEDDLTCKDKAGGQYCGVSYLSTSVKKRL